MKLFGLFTFNVCNILNLRYKRCPHLDKGMTATTTATTTTTVSKAKIVVHSYVFRLQAEQHGTMNYHVHAVIMLKNNTTTVIFCCVGTLVWAQSVSL